MSNWFSAKDKLPETAPQTEYEPDPRDPYWKNWNTSRYVLILTPYGMEVGRLLDDDGVKYWQTSCTEYSDDEFDKVTHWTELPEPPSQQEVSI